VLLKSARGGMEFERFMLDLAEEGAETGRARAEMQLRPSGAAHWRVFAHGW